MTFPPVLAASFFMLLVRGFFIVCAVCLVLVVLIQKGRGGGLSSTFGGGMASNILGSKTGDFLTWVTIGLVTVFLVLAVTLARFDKPSVRSYPAGPVPPASAPTADENAVEGAAANAPGG